MGNDAKLGLIVGVCLVLAVAVVFFRKEPLTVAPPKDAKAAAVAAPGPSPRGQARPVRVRTATNFPGSTSPRRHTVRDGETLFSLAKRYYGDGDRFVDIYRLNRNVLPAPDHLTPGTVLVIPDADELADPTAGP